MAISLDKTVPAQRTATTRPVSLAKGSPTTSTQTPPVRVLPRQDTARPSDPPPAEPNGRPSAPRRSGRLALVVAFVVGAVLAGAVGTAVATGARSDSDKLRAQLSAAQTDSTELTTKLNAALDELTATTSRLTEAEGQVDAVSARESNVAGTEAELAKRTAALDARGAALTARSKKLDATQADLASREAALNDPDVGHPLLESISDDGTWVVGRDIRPGTWTTEAYDTGCTYKVSDGRSGAGDGSFTNMEVSLRTGEKFTVHGCTLWSNFAF